LGTLQLVIVGVSRDQDAARAGLAGFS
jgi:hypothetical protein